MNSQQKLLLFADLIKINQKITWAAQMPNESTQQFGERMAILLHAFNNSGKLAQHQFPEITMDAGQREKLGLTDPCTRFPWVFIPEKRSGLSWKLFY